MNKIFRRATALFLCLTLIGLGGAALAQLAPLPLKRPSATGGFLAGEEAMRSLDTLRATQLFLQAEEGAWNNHAVVSGTFRAQAADGRIDDAAGTAQHLLELDPNDELAHVVIGTVALKERRYAAAIKELSGMEERSFLGITASILRAWALVGEGKFDQSQTALDELSKGGLEEFLVYHRALMADVADRRDLALKYAERAYKAQPFDVGFVETYVRMLANAARFDEAQTVIRKYTDEGLGQAAILSLQAGIANGKRPGKMAANVQAGAAEMFNGIGTVLSRDGTADVAAAFLRLGLYLNSQNGAIAMSLAQLYENHKQYETANAIYKGLGKNSVLNPEAIVRIAQNIDSMGNRKEALRQLHNITVVEPDNLNALSALGDMLRFDKRYAEAEKVYSAALKIVGGNHPRDWRFLYLRGICRERTDNWPAAEADFLKALELNPDHPQVLNYLGYSWIDKGVHLEKALAMIQKAIEWDPSDGYVVDSLGWAYYKLGRIDEAVQTLEQAVQLRSDDAAINDHLGDAYWKAGRRLEARFQWSIAADMKGDDPTIAAKAREKLKNGLPDTAAPAASKS